MDDKKVAEVMAGLKKTQDDIARFGKYSLGGQLFLGLSVGLYIAHEKGRESGIVTSETMGNVARMSL